MIKKLVILICFSGLIIGTGLFIYRYQRHHTLPDTSARIPADQHPDFLIVLVGDSMTEALGNSDELISYLAKDYPNKTFDILNYGFGSTNILSVPKRLTELTNHGRVFKPILDIDANIIILESFGNNPLSDLSLPDGLKKQNDTLDQIVDLIKKERPKVKLVFLATIAPNREKYGLGSVDLSPKKRAQWADERSSYIKNHIAYANSHNISLIDVYDKSIKNGDGNLDYIETKTYIHPSPKGVIFIQKQIADFIYQNKLLF